MVRVLSGKCSQCGVVTELGIYDSESGCDLDFPFETTAAWIRQKTESGTWECDACGDLTKPLFATEPVR